MKLPFPKSFGFVTFVTVRWRCWSLGWSYLWLFWPVWRTTLIYLVSTLQWWSHFSDDHQYAVLVACSIHACYHYLQIMHIQSLRCPKYTFLVYHWAFRALLIELSALWLGRYIQWESLLPSSALIVWLQNGQVFKIEI